MEKVRKFLASLSMVALLTSVMGFGAIAQAATFSDVPEDHWAYSQVEDGADAGWWKGYDDGSFGCDLNANRAEFAKMVAEAFGIEADGFESEATDVDQAEWYAPYINALEQHGIMTGDTDADGNLLNTQRPGYTINRAEAAKMVTLASGVELMDATGDVFSDVDMDAWYAGYVETGYWKSFWDGYGDGTFGPGDWLTRCQLAKMTVNGTNPVDREVDDGDDGDDDGDVDASTTDTDADGVMDDVDNCVDVSNADQADTDMDGVGDACPVPVDASDGSLTVAMGDALAGGTVPKGATSVAMLNINFSASTEDVVVSDLTFSRGGVGTTSDISNVYLYSGSDRLTTGRTVSSDTNSVSFSGLNWTVEAGETEMLTLVVDFATAATASNSHYFELQSAEAVTHNGVATDGTFPVMGSTFTLSGSSAGTVTVSKYGSLANVTVGEQDAEIAKFKLEVTNEDVWLQSLALRVRGTISNSLLTNFVLWNGSTEVASVAALNSSDLMVFTFAEALFIDSGDNEVFTVQADIGAADANDTIITDIDENVDLVAVGDVFGYGAQVDTDNSDGYDGSAGTSQSSCSSWSDASCVLVEGGQITISFNGPSSDNIAINGKDISVFDFTMSAEENVEVRRLQFTLTATTANTDSDTGDLINGTTAANFKDIKLTDVDSGSTLCSSQDVSTSGSDITQTFTCTDSFYIDAGESRHMQVTLDVASTATDGEEITMTLAGISTSEGIRSVDTGDYVTDIVPATAVTGNPMTVDTPTVTVTLASTPYSDTVVKGTANVEAVGLSFTAGDASDIRVTSVTLKGYVDANVDGTFTASTEGGVDMNEIVTSIELYDEDGNPVSSNAESFSSGSVTFSGLTWDITAGQTERLIAVVDVDKSVTPQDGTNDAFSIQLAIGSDVTAEDEDGQTVSPTGTNVNGTASPTTKITVKTSGLITVASSDDPVLDDKAIADLDSSTAPLLVARYKIYGQDEDFKVEDLKFVNDSAADNGSEDNDAITSVILKYPTSLSAPTTLDGSSSITLVSGAASFTGLSMMVPKSETTENAISVEVYVVTNAIDSALTVPSGTQIELDFEEGSGFRAVGQGSGTVVTHDSASTSFGTTTDVDANQIAIYKALPTFAAHTSSTVCPTSKIVAATESNVYCFTVMGSGSGQIELVKMTFDATQNLLNTSTGTGQLSNASGWKVYNYSSTGTVNTTAVATGTWSSTTNQAVLTFDTANTDSRVSANSTKYYVVKAPITLDNSVEGNSSLSVRIASETGTSHAAMAAAASVTGLNIWSDTSGSNGSAIVTHTTSTLDWTNSYKLETLPSTYLQLAE